MYLLSIIIVFNKYEIVKKVQPIYLANLLIELDLFFVAVLAYMFGGIIGPMTYFFIYIVLVSGYLLPPKSASVHSVIALSIVIVFLVLHNIPRYIEHDVYLKVWLAMPYNRLIISHVIVLSVVITLSFHIASYIYKNIQRQEDMLENMVAVAYHHSITDSLTGLYDQQFFRARLQEMLYEAKT